MDARGLLVPDTCELPAWTSPPPTTLGLPHVAAEIVVALVWFPVVRPRHRVPGAAD